MRVAIAGCILGSASFDKAQDEVFSSWRLQMPFSIFLMLGRSKDQRAGV
jgi:hypothetical protein